MADITKLGEVLDDTAGRVMKTSATPKPLPTKPSDLLDLAVTDAQKVQRRKGYMLNMYQWHNAGGDTSKCSVCLAGAVIACELGVPREQSVMPSHFSTQHRRALLAIDAMRIGWVVEAARHARIPLTTSQRTALLDLQNVYTGLFEHRTTQATTYANYRLSWRQYRQMARELRAIGL